MSIGVYHHPEGMTKAQYDEVISKLEAVGASSPPGRAPEVMPVENVIEG